MLEAKVVPIDADKRKQVEAEVKNNYALPEDGQVSERSINDISLKQPSFDSSVEVCQRDEAYTTFESSVNVILNSNEDESAIVMHQGPEEVKDDLDEAIKQAELVFSKIPAEDKPYENMKTFSSNASRATYQDTFKSSIS